MIPEAAVEAARSQIPDGAWLSGATVRKMLEAASSHMPMRHMSNEDLHRMGINRCPGCVSGKVPK